jgi:tyrosinase
MWQFATWGETKRWPNSWELDAYSQNDLIGPVLDNNRISFMDRLYNLFTTSHNFTEFGNEAWMNPGIQNADSLESLHDAIHSITGSNGHMTYLDYSAYDPIFFLHHAMIDRCLALWQALNTDSWVQPMVAVEQTYNIRLGSVIDENSPLEPFFSDQQRDYWTAASARDIETFGYTYPELAGHANQSAVREAINHLYGGSFASTGLVTRNAMIESQTNGAGPYEGSAPEPQRQYLANILSQKFALNGSYAIYVFLGDFVDTPEAWSTSPNLVGTHAVFAALRNVDASSNPISGSALGSSKMASSVAGDGGIQVTGTMPLTSSLLGKVAAGELSDMGTEAVGDYLEANLSWRVGMVSRPPCNIIAHC